MLQLEFWEKNKSHLPASQKFISSVLASIHWQLSAHVQWAGNSNKKINVTREFTSLLPVVTI